MITSFRDLTRNKQFVSLWISQFFSQIAVQTMNFLIIVKVYSETGSTMASTFVWIVFILPSIVLGPFAAAFVDLADKKKMLVLTNFFQMLIIFTYALLPETSLYVSYGVVFLYSLLNQFYVPAEGASLPLLVAKNVLPKANSLFLASYQIAIIIGFTLTGIVTNLLGFRSAFLISGLLMFLAFLSVNTLSSLRIKEDKEAGYEKELGNFFKRILDGYQFMRQKREVSVTFITLVMLQVSLAVVTVNLPHVASDIIGISPKNAGYFALPAGLGALFAIETVTKLLSRKVSGIRIIQSSLVSMSIGLWFLVLGIPYLSPMLKIVGAFVVSVFLGSAYVSIFVAAQTIIQTHTPNEMLARVYGNTWFITTIATVLPLIFSATITEVFGARVLFALIAVGMLGLIFIYKKKYV